MNQRQLRARIVLDEARALGLDLVDLIAADASGGALATVGSYIAESTRLRHRGAASQPKRPPIVSSSGRANMRLLLRSYWSRASSGTLTLTDIR